MQRQKDWIFADWKGFHRVIDLVDLNYVLSGWQGNIFLSTLGDLTNP